MLKEIVQNYKDGGCVRELVDFYNRCVAPSGTRAVWAGGWASEASPPQHLRRRDSVKQNLEQ